DRNADATSKQVYAQYQRGRVVAGEGLEIKPVAKFQFTALMRVTISPRPALVQMIFGRDGHVKNLTILHSIRSSDVDDAVSSAMYEGTASAREIDARSDAPEAGVKVVITVQMQ